MNTYKNNNGELVEFNLNTSLTLSNKANFVIEVAGMIVSRELGYAHILKDYIFDYCLIKYFTDIVLFENGEDFNLDMLEQFINDNQESVIDTITKEMGEDLFDELSTGCTEAIEFRKAHFSDYREDIDELLAVVREFVVKPDRMNDLITAATNALDNVAKQDKIDFTMVEKLAEIIPVMKDMQSSEVAKEIIKSNRPKKKKAMKSE
jgi:hypothetical protein